MRPSAFSSSFGLIAWLEETRVALPLKGVECRFEVTGAVASVELDQIYLQSAGRPLDCTYTFPLPAGAAVYRCELHVNGRVIRAKVEAKEKAQRIFREQKAAGRRAALVETERENLFTLSLGNVQPNDLIVVRFAWFQVLDRAGDRLRLMVPTCPGVRYIPGEPLLRSASSRGIADDTDQVPDASRNRPPRIDALHPDAAYFAARGSLSSDDVEGGSVSSPSHAIYVRESDSKVAIELSATGPVPDRDLVITWREPVAKSLVPQGWHWKEGKDVYALVQLRAPIDVEVAPGSSQDVYFLVDRSGSMAGTKWDRTCEALRAFVDLLGEEDRVWITLFESSHRDFAEAPKPAPEVRADRGFQQLKALGVAGGTELLPAALHVLRKIEHHSRKRRATVILITDGQVGNDREIERAFAKHPQIRVHTFGIDTAVNDAFLKSLARQHHGGCWLQTPHDDIAGTIASLGDRLRRPVLTEVSVAGSWKGSGAPCPDLHAREIVTLALRGRSSDAIEITGRTADGNTRGFTIALTDTGSEAIKLLWARERIAVLLADDQAAKAVALACEANLLCEGAAFIAWDEAEQVQIAREEIVQPALAPGRVEYLSNTPMLAKARKGFWPLWRNLEPEPQPPRRRRPEPPPSMGSANISKAQPIPVEASTTDDTICRFLRDTAVIADIPKRLVDAWIAWADSSGESRMQRLTALAMSTQNIARVRRSAQAPILARKLGPHIERALDGSPKANARVDGKTPGSFWRPDRIGKEAGPRKDPRSGHRTFDRVDRGPSLLEFPTHQDAPDLSRFPRSPAALRNGKGLPLGDVPEFHRRNEPGSRDRLAALAARKDRGAGALKERPLPDGPFSSNRRKKPCATPRHRPEERASVDAFITKGVTELPRKSAPGNSLVRSFLASTRRGFGLAIVC